jgi:hypothetical protein
VIPWKTKTRIPRTIRIIPTIGRVFIFVLGSS